VEFNLTGLNVFLAMPAHRDIPVDTVASLLETKTIVERNGVPIEIVIPNGGSIIEASRTQCTHLFLQTQCNRLFFVDSDIVWSSKDFIRIMALSTKMDVVMAAYPCKKDPTTFFVNSAKQDEVETNEFGCLPNVGTGLGFCCIQRHVIEKLAEKAPKLKFNNMDGLAAHVFRCDAEDGMFRGEDIAFFSDIMALGINVYLDPTVELGHYGAKIYRGRLCDHLLRR
jgi:hypothetical protein